MIWKILICISFGVVIPFVTSSGNCDPCEYHDSINIDSGFRDDNGSIFFNGHTFSPGQFFATIPPEETKMAPVKSHVRGCICKVRTCIRTCCPPGHKRVDNGRGTANCQRSDEIKNSHFPIRTQNGTISAKGPFAIVHSNPPDCGLNTITPYSKYFIDNTGDAVVGKKKISHRQYCIDYEFDEITKMTTDTLLFCEEPNKSDLSLGGVTSTSLTISAIDIPLDNDNFIIFYLLLLSILFLSLTFVFYRFVEGLYELHGKYMLYYLTSLILAFVISAIIELNTSIPLISSHASRWIESFAYFFASFCLCAIFYDFWSTIRNDDTTKKGLSIYNYSLYAVGLSIIPITLIMSCGELTTASWRPQIGNDICLISETFADIFYFFAPVSICLSINAFLCISTILKIRQLEDNKLNEENKNRLKRSRQKCFLYAYILCVVSISWFIEALTVFFPKFCTWEIGQFCQRLNDLQGVFIFIILVLHFSSRQIIKKRWKKASRQEPSLEGTRMIPMNSTDR